MPHFTILVEGNGPICWVLVGVSAERGAALVEAGKPSPDPIPLRGLIDTGASQTNVSETVLQQLGIEPKDVVKVATASTVGDNFHECKQYDAGLAIPGPEENPQPLFVPSIAVLGFNPPVSHGFQVLIGRDVLSRCILTYNGSIKNFTLAY